MKEINALRKCDLTFDIIFSIPGFHFLCGSCEQDNIIKSKTTEQTYNSKKVQINVSEHSNKTPWSMPS